jgi:hypothetical protein
LVFRGVSESEVETPVGAGAAGDGATPDQAAK